MSKIVIDSAIQNQWIWQDPQRLKWWLDLLMMAKHGQCLTSLAFLCERWKYRVIMKVGEKVCTPSYHSVLNFLKKLEDEKMITRTISHKTGTLITICNYDCYTCDQHEKGVTVEKAVPRFLPPTVEEVRDYIASKGYAVDAEQFHSFYESKGWMVGKNKMKNWHAAVATWQKKERSSNGSNRYDAQAAREQRQRELEAYIKAELAGAGHQM